MYAPGRDQRITESDSPLEFETKGKLIEAFQSLAGSTATEMQGILANISRLEAVLQEETTRQVRAYEQAQRGDA